MRFVRSLGLGPNPLRTCTRVLRAAGASAVLFVWVLAAVPTRPYDVDKLAKPHNQRFLDGMQDALSSLGVEATSEQLGALLIDVSTPVVEARNRMFKPFERAFALLGMRQSWGLFSSGGREGFRIRVEVQGEDGTWQLVYSAHEKDTLGLRDTLAYRRLRGIYNPSSKGTRAQYEGFVTWIAQRIAREHPQCRQVRVSMERLRFGSRKRARRVLSVDYESVRATSGRGA